MRQSKSHDVARGTEGGQPPIEPGAPTSKSRAVTRRGLLIAALNTAVAVPIAGAVGIGYVRAIEPGWVAIERQEFALRGLHPAFTGYRIVQLSDIHADEWMTSARMRDVVERVNALAPDLIVLTGDYVTDEPIAPYLAGLILELRRLVARDGLFGVLGNHDNWTNPTAVRAALHDAGVRELNNTTQAITRGDARLHIAGVDDYWRGEADLDAVIAELPANACAILLSHEPDFADHSGPTGRFALQLSGHSHGGQINLPLLGAPVLPPFGRNYPRGRYTVGQMIQYTNRGLGMVQPYGRFNCRPEITAITLRPAD